MADWHKAVLRSHSSILEAMRIIDSGGLQIALVVTEDGKLAGTVTDGDVRRGILRNVALDSPVTGIMNATPITARAEEPRQSFVAKMRQHFIEQLPVLDARGRLVGLEMLNDMPDRQVLDNPVVLMAGGKGRRLRPLTDNLPKPMLKVGERPILQTILENFVAAGFRQFYISVHYRAEAIVDHFGDGSQWDANIKYIHEDQPLGTAGALSLLPEKPTKPFIAMNGDLLTTCSFRELLRFHAEHPDAAATVALRTQHVEIPFGVVKLADGMVESVEEKPSIECLVNAGIYVLSPSVFDVIEPNAYLDMPSLLTLLVERGMPVAGFPLREYWLDIGRPADFERAQNDYSKFFT